MSAVERVMAAVEAHNSALPITRHVVDVKADGLLWRILREARREGCFVTVGPSELSCDCAVVSIVGGCADGNTRESENLRDEMAALLNRHSCENASGTPDFILAGFLVGCLEVWDKSVAAREEWCGRPVEPSVELVAEYDLVHVDLQNGDLIWEDDEYLSLITGNWERSSCYGEVYSYSPQYGGSHHRPHRRPFAKGYRWLRAGDIVTNGDEILEDGKWSAIDETGPYDPVTMKPVRRKI